MRKIIVMVSLCAMFIITGCQSLFDSNSLDPRNPVTVTLWHYYTGESKVTFENLINEFNKSVGASNGVVINPIAKGGIKELEEALTNSAKGVVNSEEMPNLFTSYDDKLIEIDELGKVLDLNEYFTEEDTSKYIEDFYDNCVQEDGRMLSIPLVKSTEVFYIDKTVLDIFAAETGYDISNTSTWEDYYKLSREYYNWTDEKTTEVIGDGKSFMGIDSLANYIIISNKQLGVDIIDGTSDKVVLKKDVLRQIFDLYYLGTSLGYINEVGAFRSDDVKAGELIAYSGATSGALYFPTWLEIEGKTYDIELLVDTYPTFENGQSYSVQQGAGISISKQSDLLKSESDLSKAEKIDIKAKEEGSVLFLKWITSPEQNIPFAVTSGYLPVQKSAYEQSFQERIDELSNGDKKNQNIAQVYEYAYEQIIDSNTYAPIAFKGSYDVRIMLADTIEKITNIGKERGLIYRKQGLSENEIIEKLNVDEQFNNWINIIIEELEKSEIDYIVE